MTDPITEKFHVTIKVTPSEPSDDKVEIHYVLESIHDLKVLAQLINGTVHRELKDMEKYMDSITILKKYDISYNRYEEMKV